MSGSESRIQSIDAIRALTMLLMIWVNDFWTLEGISDWLKHMPADVDGLGFSDVIFPAFLFIVGLSVPYAIQARRRKGDSTQRILIHIGERTFALLLMGFFMVNLENLSADKGGIGKYGWQILMTAAFFLIWNTYPKTLSLSTRRSLKVFGYALLVYLAAIYQGPGDPAVSMRPYWWGILGLIGWGYLCASVIYLFAGAKWQYMAAAWLGFALFNVVEELGWLSVLDGLRPFLWFAGNGSIAALTMAGVFVSCIYSEKFRTPRAQRFLIFLSVFGVLILFAGFAVRPFGGISKIMSSPSWTLLCTGISVLAYAGLYWLVDVREKRTWMKFIQPAGTATLTCYLVPYLVYAFVALANIGLPMELRTGVVGLAKSMAFAFLIIWMTDGLNRLGVKLKL